MIRNGAVRSDESDFVKPSSELHYPTRFTFPVADRRRIITVERDWSHLPHRSLSARNYEASDKFLSNSSTPDATSPRVEKLKSHFLIPLCVAVGTILIAASGCARQTHRGNTNPTSYKVMASDGSSEELNKWKNSLFITPSEISERCGPPSREWLSNSNLTESPYSVVQTHMIYSDKNAEILVSRYPNAQKQPDRVWFYSGIFPTQSQVGYPTNRALRMMPCLADKIVAWSSPPASVTNTIK
jgi:hypothetical protein